MKARDYPSMAQLRPKQALNSIFCFLVLLLAGSFELSPAAEAFSCSGNSTTQQVFELESLVGILARQSTLVHSIVYIIQSFIPDLW